MYTEDDLGLFWTCGMLKVLPNPQSSVSAYVLPNPQSYAQPMFIQKHLWRALCVPSRVTDLERTHDCPIGTYILGQGNYSINKSVPK